MTSSACKAFSYQTTFDGDLYHPTIHFAFSNKYIGKPVTKPGQEALYSLAPLMYSKNHNSWLLLHTGNVTHIMAAWQRSIAAVSVTDSNGSDFFPLLTRSPQRNVVFKFLRAWTPPKMPNICTSSNHMLKYVCLNQLAYTPLAKHLSKLT